MPRFEEIVYFIINLTVWYYMANLANEQVSSFLLQTCMQVQRWVTTSPNAGSASNRNIPTQFPYFWFGSPMNIFFLPVDDFQKGFTVDLERRTFEIAFSSFPSLLRFLGIKLESVCIAIAGRSVDIYMFVLAFKTLKH